MCLHDDQLIQTLHTGGKALSKPLLPQQSSSQNTKQNQILHSFTFIAGYRAQPPPHAGGEVLSAQILQIRKCQTTEGCDGAEISWLCATPLTQTFACSFRQALTPAPHLKSLFLRPDSRKCLSNICKYIEDEDEAVTYIYMALSPHGNSAQRKMEN